MLQPKKTKYRKMQKNPQTGKAIKIKAKKVPKFAAGKKLREAVAAAKK